LTDGTVDNCLETASPGEGESTIEAPLIQLSQPSRVPDRSIEISLASPTDQGSPASYQSLPITNPDPGPIRLREPIEDHIMNSGPKKMYRSKSPKSFSLMKIAVNESILKPRARRCWMAERFTRGTSTPNRPHFPQA